MANRSSELPKEAAAPKPKQMVGKMKIQGNPLYLLVIFRVILLKILSLTFF